jgi:Lon protease-like protein
LLRREDSPALESDTVDLLVIQLPVVTDYAEGLEEIPIFPLSTVLFPGAILPLHIFEDRYKTMMRHAIDNMGIFGLSYCSQAAVNRETPPEIRSMGCIAKINAVDNLQEGRMNMITTGLVRYRVISLPQLTPFVIARIEPVADEPELAADVDPLFEQTAVVCREFLKVAEELDEATLPGSTELPAQPEAFSLLLSSVMPVSNDAKQSLLEMTSTRLRLKHLRDYATRALSLYLGRMRIQQIAKGNGHGPKREE